MPSSARSRPATRSFFFLPGQLFLVEADKYQVFPLDNSILPRLLTTRPSSTAGRNEFT